MILIYKLTLGFLPLLGSLKIGFGCTSNYWDILMVSDKQRDSVFQIMIYNQLAHSAQLCLSCWCLLCIISDRVIAEMLSLPLRCSQPGCRCTFRDEGVVAKRVKLSGDNVFDAVEDIHFNSAFKSKPWALVFILYFSKYYLCCSFLSKNYLVSQVWGFLC